MIFQCKVFLKLNIYQQEFRDVNSTSRNKDGNDLNRDLSNVEKELEKQRKVFLMVNF